jgi:hypothetical protein
MESVDAIRICPDDKKAAERLQERLTSYVMNAYLTDEPPALAVTNLNKLRATSKTVAAILFGTAVAVSSFVNRARPSRPAVRPRAALVRGSGLPVPHRRTFASGIVPAAHCMSAALRHPGYACSHSPAPGHGQPLADFVPEWRSGEPHVPIRPWLRRRVLLS